MTDTARITYRWFDRNNLGEPLPVVRHGIGWTHDEVQTPANAPTPVQALRKWPSSTCAECGKLMPSGMMQHCEKGGYCNWHIPAAFKEYAESLEPYPFESVITESRFQWKDLKWFLPVFAVGCFAFAGFIDFVSWLRGIL